jgi:methylmalonyl-CoA/ethylmalonyl-CoA epimerase
MCQGLTPMEEKMELPADIASQKYPFTTVDQVGIVVRDVEATARVYEAFLGEGAFNIVEGEAPAVLADGRETMIKGRLGFAHLSSLQIELIQILDGESVHVDWLEKNGEGIHHLGRYTSTFDEDLEKFRKLGIGILQRGQGMRRYVYLDTRPFILELIENA